MRPSSVPVLPAIALIVLATLAPAGPARAGGDVTGSVASGSSGLPLPRFVSLKSARVNLRVGPGRDYAVDWMYLKPGLPMEIIQEYDTWRRVRDSEGTEGWINQSLLSGKRTGVVAPWQRGKTATIAMRAEATAAAATVAEIEPGAIGTVSRCDGQWCRMTFSGRDGYVEQGLVWGVYPDETFDD